MKKNELLMITCMFYRGNNRNYECYAYSKGFLHIYKETGESVSVGFQRKREAVF